MTPENLQHQVVAHCDSSLLSWLLSLLLKSQTESMPNCAICNVAEIIVFLILNNDERLESVLDMPIV